MSFTPEDVDNRNRSYTNLSDQNDHFSRSDGFHYTPKGVDRSNSQPVFRSGTWRGRVASVTANFFGIGDNAEEDQLRWRTRKSRHLSKRHGGLKPEYECTMTEREQHEINMLDFPMPHIVDPLARPGGARTLPRMDEPDGPGRATLASQLSVGTQGTVSSSIYQKQLSHRMIRQRSKRQSVARMGWDAVMSLKRPVTKPSLSHGCLVQQRPPLIHSRSFAPASLQVDEDDPDAVSLDPTQFFSTKDADSHQFLSPSVLSEDLSNEVFFDFSPKPERRVPPLPPRPDTLDHEQESSEPEEDQRTSVREPASLPTVLESEKEGSIEAETEADRETNDKVSLFKTAAENDPLVSPPQEEEKLRRQALGEDFPDTPPKLPPARATAGDALDGRTTETLAGMIPLGIGWRKKTVEDRFKMPVKTPLDQIDGDARIRRNKIQEQFMAAAFDNSDRREIGKGLVGRVLNRAYRSKRMESYVKKQIEEIEDHRPYFTYWVTTVQVIILIVSIAFYGFAPIGFSYTQKTGLVQQSNLVVETEGYMEPDNFWIGPRPADLIHLGAKFSPCMHRDAQVYEEINKAVVIENNTGCCIRTDQSGCVQTQGVDCSARFASFKKWTDAKPSEEGRHSGPVCGQDPRACLNPASAPGYEWKDDITKWPVCVDAFQNPSIEHTTCEVTGRPCCISILGKCEIVSRDYCDFVNGYFHEEATLCSQVDCLDDVCGLIRFIRKDQPDQIYRIWLSLFLHAGIFHAILSVIMQLTILRDLEKLAGWHRISVIYIFSGIGGNLTSAIFIPYRAEVGPAGSQFGLLACLAVEVLQSWQMLKSPCKALLKLLAIVCLLFALGLLPWIDNYAHIGGFICGTFLSFIFLPYICFGNHDKRRKRIQMVVSLLLVLGYFTMCFVLFYLKQFRNCSWCKYLNCVPITEDFCNDMDLILDLDPSQMS